MNDHDLNSRYQKVLEVCCLQEDVGKLAHKDLTLIGERGVNLRYLKSKKAMQFLFSN